jgi:hypothetical protein
MIRPRDLKDGELWSMFRACCEGDLDRVKALVSQRPEHVTLLHDMAHEGDINKARLLLDYGADLNAVDEEYRSTPLGYAARWGHREMVSFLLARGDDPNKAGAPWATPLAWAQKRAAPKSKPTCARLAQHEAEGLAGMIACETMCLRRCRDRFTSPNLLEHSSIFFVFGLKINRSQNSNDTIEIKYFSISF